MGFHGSPHLYGKTAEECTKNMRGYIEGARFIWGYTESDKIMDKDELVIIFMCLFFQASVRSFATMSTLICFLTFVSVAQKCWLVK